jgi:hypothetical protein
LKDELTARLTGMAVHKVLSKFDEQHAVQFEEILLEVLRIMETTSVAEIETPPRGTTSS